MAGEKPQGSVVSGRQVCVELYADGIYCNGYARCIANGEEIKRVEIERGIVKTDFTLSATQKYNFARVEIYDDKDVLIAFSNPIYLVENTGDIPLETVQAGRSE